MPRKPKPTADLADRICEAVERLTAHRQSRTNATQWIMVHDIAVALGVDESVVQTPPRAI
jgi:hypothetical protein